MLMHHDQWSKKYLPWRKAFRDFGVLIGWTAEDLGDRIILRLQSVRSSQPRATDDVHNFRCYISKDQAPLLGNYLFEVSGQSAPRRRKRSWISKLLGG